MKAIIPASHSSQLRTTFSEENARKHTPVKSAALAQPSGVGARLGGRAKYQWLDKAFGGIRLGAITRRSREEAMVSVFSSDGRPEQGVMTARMAGLISAQRILRVSFGRATKTHDGLNLQFRDDFVKEANASLSQSESFKVALVQALITALAFKDQKLGKGNSDRRQTGEVLSLLKAHGANLDEFISARFLSNAESTLGVSVCRALKIAKGERAVVEFSPLNLRGQRPIEESERWQRRESRRTRNSPRKLMSYQLFQRLDDFRRKHGPNAAAIVRRKLECLSPAPEIGNGLDLNLVGESRSESVWYHAVHPQGHFGFRTHILETPKPLSQSVYATMWADFHAGQIKQSRRLKKGEVTQVRKDLLDDAHVFEYASAAELLAARGLRHPEDLALILDDHTQEVLGELNRVVERMGDEPNMVFAAHLAQLMLNLPEGASYDDVVKRLRKSWDVLRPEQNLPLGFDASDLQLFQQMYPIIPRWENGKKGAGAPSTKDLSHDAQKFLLTLARIPVRSKLLAQVRGVGSAMRGTKFVFNDLAVADNLNFLREAIEWHGAIGKDIYTLWKDYPKNPVIITLARRMFGVDGVQCSQENIQERTEAKIEEAMLKCEETGQRLGIHLLGVKSWDFVADCVERHPGVCDIIAVSHTTSDADELRDNPELQGRLRPVSLAVMADSQAKIEHEKRMFGASFQNVLGDLERVLPEETGFRHRPIMLYGMGKLIGPAALKASRARGYSNISVVDPRYEDNPALLKELDEMDVAFVSTQDDLIWDEVINHHPILMNCSPNHVLNDAMMESAIATGQTLFYLNFGTGKKDIERIQRQALNKEGELVGYLGSLPVLRYEVYQLDDKYKEGRSATVYMVGDGRVANHNSPFPNPNTLSDLNNAIKLRAFERAEHGLGFPPGHTARYGAVESIEVIFAQDDNGHGAEAVLLTEVGERIRHEWVEQAQRRLDRNPAHKHVPLQVYRFNPEGEFNFVTSSDNGI